MLAGRPGAGPPGGGRGGDEAIAPFDVHRIAALARIDLSAADGRRLGRQLEEVVGYLDLLPRGDEGGEGPTDEAGDRVHVATAPGGGPGSRDSFAELVEAADEPAAGLPHEAFLANAPDVEDGFLRVPALRAAGGSSSKVEDDDA